MTTIKVPDRHEGMTPIEDAAYHYYMAMQHLTHCELALKTEDPKVDLKIAIKTDLSKEAITQLSELVRAYAKAN